jgi:hypothetical protein
MKAEYTSSNGRLKFAVEGATPKDLFGELAGIQEVFDAESRCGCCQSDDIHYRVRVAQKFEFYELVCMGCNARFAFGQSKDLKNLFPKRREDGKNLPNGGWAKYDPNSAASQEYEDHQRTQAPAATMPKPGATGELAGWLDRLDRDTGKFGAICGILLERLTACGPTAVREYDRIAKAFGAKNRVELNDYKACVCDLHAALKRFEK